MFAHDEAAETLEEVAKVALKAFRHVVDRFVVLAEGQHDGRDEQASEQYTQQAQRGVDADGFHRDNLHGEESHHRRYGREARQEHAPARFTHSFDDGKASSARLNEACLEEVVEMDVIGYGASEGENHGNHGRTHVDVEPCPPNDAESYHERQYRREQRCDHATQRTGDKQHDDDGDHERE